MDYISNQEPQNQEMLKTLGLSSIDPLLSAIPKSILLPPILEDDGKSELEGKELIETLAKKNTFESFDSYLGAGAYDHYTPAMTLSIASRSEFLTTYTPYQPEASQGSLQAIFEFQSMIAALTAMDAANASLYDGASAAAEAVLMALRLQEGRDTVLICSTIHPFYQDVIKLYLKGKKVKIKFLAADPQGKIDEKLLEMINEEAAALIIQSPNFFGIHENLALIGKKLDAKGALFITIGNPLSYALFKPPGEYEADIAVGDIQPLGLPLNFGGPYAGFMACKMKYIRQLPGRLVAETTDLEGKRGFVLTLQPREQHIRREKATSNICSNQALAALMALMTSVWYGPHGLYELSLTNYQRAAYLRETLIQIKGFSAWELGFNEFTLHLPVSAEKAIKHFRKEKIEPGVSLERFFPKMKNSLLVAVTELKGEEKLNRFIEVAKQL